MEKTKEIVELLFRSAVNPELQDNVSALYYQHGTVGPVIIA